jgi:para-nitrobenzyl esterase
MPLGKAEEQGVAVADKLARVGIAALRSVPPTELQRVAKTMALDVLPVTDGVLLPNGPWSPVSDVPMLVGLTADEGSMIGADYGSSDDRKLGELLRASFGAMAGRAGALYASASPADRATANKQIWRDSGLGAIYAWAAQRATAARMPVYAYVFTQVEPGVHAKQWGAFHSSEIPYIFQTFDASPERAFTAKDRSVSQRISALWTNFIKTGDPNGPGLPAWPMLTASQPQVLQIGRTIRIQPLLPADKLELVEEYVASGGSLRIF